MSVLYYINELEFEVSQLVASSTDSLIVSLLDQKCRHSSSSDILQTTESQEQLCLKTLIKEYIMNHLSNYEEDLIIAASRFFGLPEISYQHRDFLIPGILHAFLFGGFQNTKLTLDVFSNLYQVVIQVIILIS
jgi:hypothetical protein